MSATTSYHVKKGKHGGDNLFSRRDSVATAGMELQEELFEKLAELRGIWNEVGMSEEQRRERMETALNHVRGLMSDMVEEEIGMRDTLRNSLAESRKEIETLLKQLHQPKPEFLQHNEEQCTLLDLEEKCRLFKLELEQERDYRVTERDRLLSEHAKFASLVGALECEFNKHSIPDKTALEKLAEEVDQIKKRWECNSTMFCEKRQNIISLLRKVQIDQIELTRFQRDAVSHDGSEQNHDFVLSREHMLELADLETLLQDKYNVYLEEVRQRISVLQSELVKWWEQCHAPLAERERFQTVDPELDPEKAVSEYHAEIDRLRAFYESRKTVLDKIGEWEKLWQEHVEFEERERDTNRLHNRGGALLQEEKKRKKVQAMLPQVFKQLSVIVAEYDLAHPDDLFVMNGVPVLEYISGIERGYVEKKKREKEEKELLKRQQLMTERLYGTSAGITPGSQRKRVQSVNVTPTKLASPVKKGLCSGGPLKVYVHSSLAALRSPGAKQVSQAGPSASKKHPAGLPTGQKRKAFGEQQDDVQRIAPLDAAATSDGHTTLMSTASYGEFANALRAKGMEGQSSFIGGGQLRSPQKMPRMN